MGELDLRIEHLVLDNDNPRITHSEGQHQTLQKVIKDQKMKLVRLAESIVEHGLSPIERLMVLEVSGKPKRYVALEGNRRVTALKLLTNPAVMTGLDMPPGMQKAFEQLAGVFVRSEVEPIASYEVNSREEGRYWIELRHNGEDEGRGVVSWKPIVAARYRNKEPAVQALEMVLEHGGLSENDVESIQSNFKLTTLRRLIDSTAVRDELGLSVKDGKLHTDLPGAEVIKPLKKMVLDIADKKVDTRTFNKTEQMLTYVKGFGKSDKPDRAKKVAQRAVEGIEKKEFTKPPKSKPARKATSPSARMLFLNRAL